ncbi:MAG TPA: metallopeptidase TldD-related protein [Gemmatimonadaceae bacterium]|nr:metallopeptidase TldD-related protein [Gemmatimonadaceae bacterium]
MSFSRREFMKVGATAAAAVVLPRSLALPRPVTLGRRPEPMPPIDDPRLKELVARGLDAARGAGAAYADVRLTHARKRDFRGGPVVSEVEEMVVGVRALVDGYWGFASGPVWSPDEMARLGREATAQARTNALGKRRVVELASVSVVPDGRWVMPVKIDPFDVPPTEVMDHLQGLSLHAERTPGVTVVANDCSFTVQEKAFGSTDGSYCAQRTYLTSGEFAIKVTDGDRQGAGTLDCLTPAGLGWELFRDQPLRERIAQLIADIRADMKLPVKPVDVGRYDAVFDAPTMAALVAETIGRATELDRALGYEANAGGTSYLDDPLAMLGSYHAGSPSLTVNADRSMPGGAATVKWDDEGVAPDDFALVKDGVLVDFQTTRESAGWLKDYYTKAGRPVRSHGCASAPSAVEAPLQRAPNLTMTSGRERLDFDGLVAGLASGIAVKGAAITMDFQHLNGMGLGRVYEVRKGKRVAIIAGAGLLFRAPELWKGLFAVGGSSSLQRYGLTSRKGEPAQAHVSSVTAPPAAFRQITVVDPLRKA